MVRSPNIFDIYNYGIILHKKKCKTKGFSLVNSYLSQLAPTIDQLVLRKF